MNSKLAIQGGTPVHTTGWPNWPIYDHLEEQSILEVLHSGKWWYVDGTKVREFEGKFSNLHHSNFATAVTNGSAAIEVALKALSIGCGDEVIVPAYTFVATAASVLAVSATPIFVDIDPSNLNIDPKQVEAAVTSRTRAIIPVHIAGCPADMDAILDIARTHNLAVIEDAAQAVCAEWNGKPVGALGDCGTFSFQASKNLNSGEGGVVISNDESLADLIWSVANVGRTRGGKKYEHPVLGSNYRLTEFQAAILLAQMTRLEEQSLTRTRNAKTLSCYLHDISGITTLKLDPRVTRHAYHLYIFRYNSAEFGGHSRDEFVEALKSEGIPASDGYLPLYGEEVFHHGRGRCQIASQQSLEQYKDKCPTTEAVCADGIWLPQNALLGTETDMQHIVEAIVKIKTWWS